MSVSIITVAGRRLAVGLVWRLLDEGGRAEIAAIAAECQATEAVPVMPPGGGAAVSAGFAEGGTGGRERIGLPSAAALLAGARGGSVLVAERVQVEGEDDEAWWIAASSDHVVLPDTDVLIRDRGEAEARIADLAALGRFELMGSAAADLLGGRERGGESFAAWVETFEERAFKAALLRSARGPGPWAWLGALALLALGGGLLWWALREPAPPPPDPALLRQQARAALESRFATDMTGPTALQLAARSVARVDEMPWSPGDWGLSGAQCELSGCYVAWRRRAAGSVTAFLSGFPIDLRPEVALDGESAGLRIPLGVDYGAPDAPEKVTRRDMVALCVEARRAGGSRCEVRPGSVVQIPHGELLPPGSLHQVGAWTAKGEGGALSVAARALVAPGVIAEKLEISVDGPDVVWTLTGRYVTREDR